MLGPARVPGDIIVFNQTRYFVDVLSREVTAAPEGHELKSILLLGCTWRPDKQSDRLFDKAAHRGSGRCRSIFELLEQLVVQRDGSAHDA